MAIWQFDVSFMKRGGPLPHRTGDGYEAPSLTEGCARQAGNWLNAMFGRPWAMMDGWYVFGEEAGNRIDLLTNTDGSSELSARVDMRSDDASFIVSLCELANAMDCTLFSPELWRHVEPLPTDVTQAASASRAAVFVQNPARYLAGIARGV